MGAPSSIFSRPGRICTTVRRTVDSGHEPTVPGGATLTHDNAGDMTTNASGNTLIYDAWNRRVLENSSGSVMRTYRYDAIDRRRSGQRH